MQRKWYRSVLEKDIDAVNGILHMPISPFFIYTNTIQGLTGKKEGKTRLMNMVMQVIPSSRPPALSQLINHPLSSVK